MYVILKLRVRYRTWMKYLLHPDVSGRTYIRQVLCVVLKGNALLRFFLLFSYSKNFTCCLGRFHLRIFQHLLKYALLFILHTCSAFLDALNGLLKTTELLCISFEKNKTNIIWIRMRKTFKIKFWKIVKSLISDKVKFSENIVLVGSDISTQNGKKIQISNFFPLKFN